MKSILSLLYSFSAFVLFSSFFIAFCSTALILSTYLIVYGNFNRLELPVILLVFSSVIFIYNYNAFFSYSFIANSVGKEWMISHKRTLSLLVTAAIFIILISALYISFDGLIIIAHLFAISLLYGLPLKWGKTKLSLRSIPFIKAFLIAYVWTVTTVLLPVFESGGYYRDSTLIGEVISRFVFILALVLPFDIRDYETDKEEKIKTIPIAFGESGTKALIFCLMLFYIIVSFLSRNDIEITIVKSIAALLGIAVSFKISSNRDDFYYTFAIDGVMMLQFILIVLVNYFL